MITKKYLLVMIIISYSIGLMGGYILKSDSANVYSTLFGAISGIII